MVEGLEFFGVEIDEKANEATVGVEGLISKKTGKVKVYAIPTNEELVIASDTARIVKASKKK